MSLRKIIKNRSSFPTDEAVSKLLYLALNNIAMKWTMPIRWKQEIAGKLTRGTARAPAARAVEVVMQGRATLRNILDRRDPRMFVIVGRARSTTRWLASNSATLHAKAAAARVGPSRVRRAGAERS